MTQTQPPMKAPTLPAEAIGDVKDNIMKYSNYLFDKIARWLKQGCKFDSERNLWVGPNERPLLPNCIHHHSLQ